MGINDVETGGLGAKLLELQAGDTEIFELGREIEGLEDKHRIGEIRAELGAAEGSLARMEKELEELEHRQHKLDGELDLLSTKIKTEEGKLFSGTIMNPKELSAIQAEIMSLRKKRDEMETEDLELMEAVDGARDTLEREKAHGGETRERLAEETTSYERELAELRRVLAGREQVRDRLKESLDEDMVRRYEKLLKEKSGLAVVRIEQGRNCGGCHIEFSRTQVDRFQHEEGVFGCEYCRRILVK